MSTIVTIADGKPRVASAVLKQISGTCTFTSGINVVEGSGTLFTTEIENAGVNMFNYIVNEDSGNYAVGKIKNVITDTQIMLAYNSNVDAGSFNCYVVSDFPTKATIKHNSSVSSIGIYDPSTGTETTLTNPTDDIVIENPSPLLITPTGGDVNVILDY